MTTDRTLQYIALGLAVFLAACGQPGDEGEQAAAMDEMAWSYEGQTGPDQWGELSAEYAVCGTGEEQSPINIVPGEAMEADLAELSLQYGEAQLGLEDTGHGYKATPDGEHVLNVGGDTYRLLQFHAHTPSEHTLNGEYFPMEVHFVHQNEAGQLAVVGVMIAEGAAASSYSDLVGSIEGAMGPVSVDNLRSLLPSDLTYFTYPGSLTTPPCSEGVRWLVLEHPITMSAEQLAVFEEGHGTTNRPTLPLQGREVRYSGE